MRPGDFSPGNSRAATIVHVIPINASMRPGDFSPGNPEHGLQRLDARRAASMRPGDFSPGNITPFRTGDELQAGLQ